MVNKTTAPNPNYSPPMPAAVEMAIGRVGAGIWDKEASIMWWGDWRNDPAFVALLNRLGIRSPGEAHPLQNAFTPAEIEALKQKHGSANVNWQRAEAVKKAMGEGYTTLDKIVERLGGAFGRTQISMDKSALQGAQK